METRTVTEVRVYKLLMNDVHNTAESSDIVAFSTDYDRLVQWYKEQFAPVSYRDEDGYCRRFRKDSVLYNFNPIVSTKLNSLNRFDQGIQDEWIPLDILEDSKHYYWFIDESGGVANAL